MPAGLLASFSHFLISPYGAGIATSHLQGTAKLLESKSTAQREPPACGFDIFGVRHLEYLTRKAALLLSWDLCLCSLVVVRQQSVCVLEKQTGDKIIEVDDMPTAGGQDVLALLR